MCYSVMVERDIHQHQIDFLGKMVKDSGAYERFGQRMQIDPKIKVPDEDSRIFPGYYTSVLVPSDQGDDGIKIRPMRYSAYPPSYMDPRIAKGLSTFNARRDSLLKRFWSESFGYHHGIVVIRAFFEWVSVKDLIAAHKISLSAVKDHFDEQSKLRRAKWLEKGKSLKSLKPTKTELKDPLDRDVVISFSPEDDKRMLLPVIFSYSHDGTDSGFAIITDDPRPEILQAGHDRMPICLSQEAALIWLNSAKKTPQELNEILGMVEKKHFVHRLPKVS